MTNEEVIKNQPEEWYRLLDLIPKDRIPSKCKRVLMKFIFICHGEGPRFHDLNDDYVYLPYAPGNAQQQVQDDSAEPHNLT